MKYSALVRANGEAPFMGHGVYASIEEAQKAVRVFVGKLGLRCLFKWEANLYRCGDEEKNVYGKVVPFEETSAQAATEALPSGRYDGFRTEELEFLWDAVHKANPGTSVPHARYVLWLHLVSELADTVRKRRGN